MEKFVLLVTHKEAFEADLIVRAARERGLPLIRFNQDDYPERISVDVEFHNDLVSGKFRLPRKEFRSGDIGIAWYQQSYDFKTVNASGIELLKRQETIAFQKGLWDALEIPWFNSPRAVKESNKLRQLRLAQGLGIKIPYTLITTSKDEILRFYYQTNGKCIFKTLDTQTIEIDGKQYASYTHEVDQDVLSALDGARLAPTMFQEKIDKLYELRIVVIDQNVFVAKINSQGNKSTSLDWRKDPEIIQLNMEKSEIPDILKFQILDLMASLDLRFGALDFIVNLNKDYVFLEINSTPSWNWTQRAVGYPIGDVIIKTLERSIRQNGV